MILYHAWSPRKPITIAKFVLAFALMEKSNFCQYLILFEWEILHID